LIPNRVLGARLDSLEGAPSISNDPSFNNELTHHELGLHDPIIDNTDGMDSKIDEALQLVDRIGDTENSTNEAEQDNLDIPAFLRSGMRDLSLS
jgi:hypothetical protein